MTCYN